MRVMACDRWVGVGCDRCDRAAVSEDGLRGVLGSECWFHHARLVNRHVCASCFEGLPTSQRAEYVRATGSEIGEPRRRSLTNVPATG